MPKRKTYTSAGLTRRKKLRIIIVHSRVQKFGYVENVRAQCNSMVSEIAKVVDDWKADYRLVMNLDPHHPELKKLLIRIRMLWDIKKFCQAVLDRKTESLHWKNSTIGWDI